MQINTLFKVGSLAFDMAQDDKVRELATLVHRGARRRGLLGGPTPAGGHRPESSEHSSDQHSSAKPAHSNAAQKPRMRIPFEPNPGEPLPWLTGAPIFGVPVGKYLTGGNSRRLLHYAKAAGRLLIR